MHATEMPAGSGPTSAGPSDNHPLLATGVAVSTCNIRFGCATARTLNVQGSGRPIILLHPFGENADNWEPVLEILSRYGNSAHAPDLLGSGLADGFREGPLLPQLDEFVAAVVAVHRSEGPVILVGVAHSAVLALRTAAAAPADIHAVIAVGVPRGESPIERFRPSATPALRRALRQLSSDQCLPAVKCPSLIVQGLRGTSGAAGRVRRFHEALPNSRVALLPRSGQFAHLDNPMRIATYAREMATMSR